MIQIKIVRLKIQALGKQQEKIQIQKNTIQKLKLRVIMHMKMIQALQSKKQVSFVKLRIFMKAN